MMRTNKGHSISGVFVFLLLGAFAVFGTLLVLLGAQAYRGMTIRTADHNENRILTSFIRHVVHGQDAVEGISVQEIDGYTVLVIRDNDAEPDEELATYIYADDGILYELYTDGSFRAGVGEEICSASSLSATIQDGLLQVTVCDAEGKPYQAAVALYSAQ